MERSLLEKKLEEKMRELADLQMKFDFHIKETTLRYVFEALHHLTSSCRHALGPEQQLFCYAKKTGRIINSLIREETLESGNLLSGGRISASLPHL